MIYKKSETHLQKCACAQKNVCPYKCLSCVCIIVRRVFLQLSIHIEKLDARSYRKTNFFEHFLGARIINGVDVLFSCAAVQEGYVSIYLWSAGREGV